MKARRLNQKQLRRLNVNCNNSVRESQLDAGFQAGVKALSLYLEGYDIDYIQEVLSPASVVNPPFWDIIENTFQEEVCDELHKTIAS